MSSWRVTAPSFSLQYSNIHDYFGTQKSPQCWDSTLRHTPKGTTSSFLAGGSANLNSMFLVLVKITPGRSKCPQHSQNWKLLGQSALHVGWRAAHTWYSFCGTVVKRRRRGFRLAMVKTPGLSMQAIHPVGSKNISSSKSSEITWSYSRAQSDC